MHQNSLLTYMETTTKRKSRAQIVLEAFKRLGAPATDREILKSVGGGGELNYVRPRITELIKAGLVEEVGNVLCPIGGRTVRVCRVKRMGEV